MLAVPYKRRPYTSPVDGFDSTDSIPSLVASDRTIAILFAPIVWLFLSSHTHLGDIKSPMDVVVIAFQFVAPGFAAYYSNKNANAKVAEFAIFMGNHPMYVSRSSRIQFIVGMYVFLIACGVLLLIGRSSVTALPAGVKWAHVLLLCVSLYLVCRRPPWMWDILETQWGAQATYNVAVMSLLIYVNNWYATGFAFLYLGIGYSLIGLLQPGSSNVKVNR